MLLQYIYVSMIRCVHIVYFEYGLSSNITFFSCIRMFKYKILFCILKLCLDYQEYISYDFNHFKCIYIPVYVYYINKLQVCYIKI